MVELTKMWSYASIKLAMPSEPYVLYGSLPNYPQTLRSAFSTPKLNQFFSMAVKRGKLLSLSTTNSKSSSTIASDTSLTYGGLTKYQIKSSGIKPNMKK